MLAKRLIKSNDAGGGACTNTVDLYNPFPDGGGLALYQLNGDATDVSGNYNGTATNVTYGTGQFGQAGVFNGSSYINNTSISGFPLGASERTLSFWVNPQGSGVRVIGGYGSATTAQYFGLSITASNGINFLGYNYNLSTTYTIPQNQWVHIVTTYDGTTQLLYANGVQVYSAARTYNTGSSEFRIGDDLWGTTERFNGSIDQVRIFNRALRPYEVEALYTEEYCTPTIVPSEHFNTITYSGDGQARSFTGVGFQPDLVWFKNRNDSFFWHTLWDSVRGPAKDISSNATDAQNTNSSRGYLTSFDSDGMSVVPGSVDIGNMNAIGNDVVAWTWKAGGAEVSANSIEATNATRSANPEAGFSIIKFTSSSSTVQPPPMNYIEHGLNSAPKMVIYKNIGATENWLVQHDGINTNGGLNLNLTSAQSGPFTYDFFDNTATSIGVRSNYAITRIGTYIAYAFAEVEGFSNFGSYAGTGASGNAIVTGFEPAFIIIKASSAAPYGNWMMFDNKRGTYTGKNPLYANLSDAEGGGSGNEVKFLENGFELGLSPFSEFNGNGISYIYMAFAADPTTIEPSLEDSFNTVTYTGTNSSLPITGVGFQPDLVWIKNRTGSVDHHSWIDSVRGKNSQLFSNLTNGENTFTDQLDSFDSDGFTVGTGFIGAEAGRLTNKSGVDYVAWCWKGAELPAINSNGSIPSVVSANPAAGFSIVSYTGNGLSNQTIGHGLGQTPDMIITKGRANLSTYDNWDVWHKDLTLNYILNLQNTAAEGFAGVDQRFVTSLNSSDVFGVGPDIYGPNSSGTTKIAYCFAEVAGFSKFGSYTGNNSTNGPVIECGFEPAFVIIKSPEGITNWSIYDNKRDTSNPRNHILWTNLSDAELVAYPQTDIDFNATNFQLKGTNGGINGNGFNYIYMAFANQF